jgi:DNA polymerase IV
MAELPPRRILLIDADAFYVAVARMLDPDGAGRARLLIVGGSAQSRGVVCSASYETRAFGVRSAMPMSRAVRLCPKAMVVPVPPGCGKKSREVRAVLERFTPHVEGASIDEWYLDLAGTEALYGHEPLAETARRIRAAVKSETGISVSIGGGTSKLVAKLAVERAKPHKHPEANGVHVVATGTELEFMQQFALADIPGVGPKTAARLDRHGLRTVPDVLAADMAALVRAVGEREAAWLWERAHGVSESDVAEREVAKQMSRDETFAKDIVDDSALERELLALATRVGADLRGDGLRARTITVRIRDADFTNRSAGRTLPEGIESDKAVFAVARELLKKLRRARRVPARLLSVAVSNFASEETQPQLALFEAGAGMTAPIETERDRAVSRAVDEVRAKLGATAILPGGVQRGR